MDEPLPEIPSFTLNSGFEIPATAFPTWRVDPQKHRDGEEESLAKDLRWALEMGWRHIDCAQVDLNLKTVGNVLDAAVKNRIVERSSLFITSKVWNTHHSYVKCNEAVNEMLSDLQLDYIDLMLIHWPHGYSEAVKTRGVRKIEHFFPKENGKLMYSDVDYLETWRVLEEAVEDGRIRTIGVCNFNKEQLQRLIDNCRITPAVLQLEMTPYLAQSELREFCKKHKILVSGYSGLYSQSLDRYAKRVVEDPMIIVLQRELKIHSVNIIMRWYYEIGVVSVPFFHMKHNYLAYLKIFDFQLSPAQVTSIEQLDRGVRNWNSNPRDVDHPLWPLERELSEPSPPGRSLATAHVPKLKLNSGFEMPMVGFATWRAFRQLIADGWPIENTYRAFTWAVEHGYRHADCAFVDMNQKQVGKVVREYIKRGELRRQEFFITSKVWNTFHSTHMCQEAINITMAHLKLTADYIDLMLVHWPQGFAENHEAVIREKGDLEYTELCERFPNDGQRFIHSSVDYLETWRALEAAVDEATIRSIGVANFNLKQLERLWNAARIKPAVLQIPVSPYYPNEGIRQFCDQKGIVVAAHDPLGRKIAEDPVIVKISTELRKTPEQIVLRWLIEKRCVVLPRSYNSDELISNLKIFDFFLSTAHIMAIDSLEIVDCPQNDEPDWPFYDRLVTTKPIAIPTTRNFPMIALTFWGENGPRGVRFEDIERAVRMGFRSFDCSHAIFDRERINDALKAMDKVTVNRCRCYVVSRIWPSYRSVRDCRILLKRIEKQIDGGRRSLVLQWPRENEVRQLPGGLSNLDYLTTWRQIEEATLHNKFSFNGLCNFNIEQIRTILEVCEVTPKFAQLEINPYHQQVELREFCQDNDILVVGYSPFGGGVLRDPVIVRIGREVGKTPQQVVIRWYQEHGIVALTESFDREDLLDVLDVFHFRLTPLQMKSIDELEKGVSSWPSKLLVEHSNPTTPRYTIPLYHPLTMRLNSGYDMPMLALATWRAEPDEPLDFDYEFKAVKTAVELGCRHVDTAFVDLNLRRVSEGFWKTVRFRNVNRDKLFITSKVWNTSHSSEKCAEIVDETMRSLRIAHLDLMLIHWPQGYEEGGRLFPGAYSSVDYLETWRALEDAVKAGKVRSIGVCNFNKKQIERVWENARIRPSVVYIEMNPYLQQAEMREFCRREDIAVVAYAPFGGSPDSADSPDLWADPVILEIAQQVQKTPLQVILRWFIEHDVTVSWKFFKTNEVKESVQIFDFTLSPDQIERIDGLDKGLRTWNDKIHDEDHPYWPFRDEC